LGKDNESIHEFDVNLICEYFLGLKRQGPGSPEVTVKALSFIEGLSKDSNIVDIGCGTGGQTMVIAQNAPGRIIGVDLFSTFVEKLNENAKALGLQDRVEGIIGSMDNLPFNDEEFDVIWCEGAIYNIGFERGLMEWRRFLKKGGYIAVTEASWFTEERPEEIEKFWQDAYPGIDTIANKVAQMQKTGYVPVAVFTLPESCWIDNFYVPQIKLQEEFLKRNEGNDAAARFVEYQRYEAELYHKYKEYYGYAFYIGRKI
jgi:SAM-dependent methyltransferase